MVSLTVHDFSQAKHLIIPAAPVAGYSSMFLHGDDRSAASSQRPPGSGLGKTGAAKQETTPQAHARQ